MNDNQKQVVAAMNFFNKLMDLVEEKKISLFKAKQIISEIQKSIQETDLADKLVERINEVLTKEKLDVKINYNLE